MQEGVKVVVERSISASRVKEVLESLFAERGAPACFRSDGRPDLLRGY